MSEGAVFAYPTLKFLLAKQSTAGIYKSNLRRTKGWREERKERNREEERGRERRREEERGREKERKKDTTRKLATGERN
jgi:hypothetical protein